MLKLVVFSVTPKPEFKILQKKKKKEKHKHSYRDPPRTYQGFRLLGLQVELCFSDY